MLSIANTDNKHGRFDSIKFCEGFSFRKFDAIEPLRCCVIHGGSKAPKFLKGCLSENLVLSNRCAAVLSMANTENKQGRFDSSNFSGGLSFINLVLSNRCVAVLSIANDGNKQGRFDSTKFSEGLLLENLVLSNRCAAVLSISNTENKQGRFDSTKFSEGFSFRKFGAIEPLRCCVIHCEY